MHLWRACWQTIFQVFLQLMAITWHMTAWDDNGNWTKFVCLVYCAARHLYRVKVGILNSFQDSDLLWRASKPKRIMINSLALRKDNSLQVTSHIICIGFQVTFFADNFREFVTLNAVYEELFKLNILMSQGRSMFKKERILIDKGGCGIQCFAIYFGFVLV